MSAKARTAELIAVFAIFAIGAALAGWVTGRVLPPLGPQPSLNVVAFVTRFAAFGGMLLAEYPIANAVFHHITGKQSLWRWMTDVANSFNGSRTTFSF
jgi:hypothetical protein